jgi:peptidyl-prolyl cis-trans isomerase B (cyclophilin B)
MKAKILKIVAAVVLVALVLTAATLFFPKDQTPVPEYTPTHYADIVVEDFGTITVALAGDVAPKTVENFVALAQSGFYDGLTFHRVARYYMIQGGCPNGDGTGDSDATIPGEFAENGIENPLPAIKGAIVMARKNDYNSASCQFFLIHENVTHLSGLYAVFGYITEGFDVVDEICRTVIPLDRNGDVPKEDQPVIKTITIRPAA